MDDRAERWEWRLPPNMLFMFVFVGFGPIAFVFGVGIRDALNPQGTSWVFAVWLVIMGGWCLFCYCYFWRPRLRVSVAGLVVRNRFATERLAWSQLSSASGEGDILCLTTVDGDRITVDAFTSQPKGRAGVGRAQEVADLLRSPRPWRGALPERPLVTVFRSGCDSFQRAKPWEKLFVVAMVAFLLLVVILIILNQFGIGPKDKGDGGGALVRTATPWSVTY